MRVLVTGGAGFLGSHIVDALKARGDHIVALDDLSTGDRANLDPAIELAVADVSDRDAVRERLSGKRFDAVVHAAAKTKVVESMAKPELYRRVIVEGTANALDVAQRIGATAFVNVSTGGAMYGETPTCANEESPIDTPSPYGRYKAEAERLVATTPGLRAVTLRFANIYGPRQGVREEGAVVAVFATRMAADQPVTIDGTGQQTRDFVYVGDCVTANIAALERGSGGAFNIGTGRETSIREIFDGMAEVAGYTHQPQFGPARKGDVVRIVLNPALAAQQLDWRAAMPLHEGLTKTYRFFSDGR